MIKNSVLFLCLILSILDRNERTAERTSLNGIPLMAFFSCPKIGKEISENEETISSQHGNLPGKGSL